MSERLRPGPRAALSLLLVGALHGCTTEPEMTLPICRLAPDLTTEVLREIDLAGENVRAGIWLARPESEPLFAIQADVAMPCASSIKTSYMLELFAESPDLDAPFPGASAILDNPDHPAVVHFSAEQRETAKKLLGDASIRRMAEAMMTGRGVDNATYNIAANLVTAHFGGPTALTRRLHERAPGWRGLYVRRYMLANRKTNGDNEATSHALGAVLEQMALGAVPGVSPEALDAARQIMAKAPEGPSQRFTKGGSLNSNPVTRVRTGFRTGPTGSLVWAIMLIDEAAPTERQAAGPKLAKATQTIERLLLRAAP